MRTATHDSVAGNAGARVAQVSRSRAAGDVSRRSGAAQRVRAALGRAERREVRRGAGERGMDQHGHQGDARTVAALRAVR